MNTYKATANFKLIYVYRINDAAHEGYLKVGEATVDDVVDIDELIPNCEKLKTAAHKRIDHQTKTAVVAYELLHAELAVRKMGNYLFPFGDKEVHKLLTNTGVDRRIFPQGKGKSEWFRTNLATICAAIKTIKAGDNVFDSREYEDIEDPIEFRPEQIQAIERTCKQFEKHKKMLWNAKMRFGKTLCALEVVRRCGFKRTIIFTHRPVVSDGWFDDFKKIFHHHQPEYHFGSKQKGKGASLEDLVRECEHFVYFASIQDLRGSVTVGGRFDKDELVYQTQWDCAIIDEAHEGTQTELGQKVIKELIKGKTKSLHLSGTPFNLQDAFNEDETYTWNYVDEQRAKRDWELNHLSETNPYADLPRLNIFTYDLNKEIAGFEDWDDSAFNFREFFRVWTGDEQRDGRKMPDGVNVGSFVHYEAVSRFLDLMTRKSSATNYPYATEEYRNNFKHTLWMLPGVSAAKALKELMEQHPVFGCGDFRIINVAGEGVSDELEDNALDAVRTAISGSGRLGSYSYTITLSCGRLTTGVTVKEWTAVFMLSGSSSTSAAGYLQTIFRVQSPGSIDGKMKTECYAFDFAPDRALIMVSEAAQVETKAGKTKEIQRKQLGEFLNFCPVIALQGSNMQPYDADNLLQQVKRAYVERVVRSGFEDKKLYNDQLLQLGNMEWEQFEKLRKIVGTSKLSKGINKIDISTGGFTDEKYDDLMGGEKETPVRSLSPEERKKREEARKERLKRETAISILRGISIRIPLLVYGADIPFDDEVSPENIVDIVDDKSWQEFMPQGVTKRIYRQFTQYYDRDIFVASAHRIRELARNTDMLPPLERIKRIAEIFSFFRNPDKETVLTPWRVVNMHVNMVFGGFCFFDEAYENQIEVPRYSESLSAEDIFSASPHLLEINAKTGLYALLLTYNVYCRLLRDEWLNQKDVEKQERLWDKVVSENIYAICRTPMAKSITRRTLVGYREGKVNIWENGDTIGIIRSKPEKFITDIQKFVGKRMKIDAVIGNPPYQEEGEGTRKSPVYHYFYDVAFSLSDKVSLITPGRFLFRAGQTPRDWTERILKDPHFKVVRYYQRSTDVFPSVDIKGGVVITYRNQKENFGAIGFFSDYPELKSILAKVVNHKDFVNSGLSKIVSSQGIYRFTDELFKDFPQVLDVQGKGTAAKITSRSLEKLPEIFLVEQPENTENYIQIIGRSAGHRVIRWIKTNYVQYVSSLYSYKIFVPEANGTGAIGEVLSTPMIGTPMIGTTDTFLSIGEFDNAVEAENCLKYIKSKFARTMLGTLKATQHNPKETWANVPMQNFTDQSDIDWNVGIPEIDKQLYDKYDLNREERDFIEKMIKKI